MVSTRDLENVVAQVNAKFDELFKRLVKLEEQLAAKPTTGTDDASKKRSKTN